jgi:hypothetical protein
MRPSQVVKIKRLDALTSKHKKTEKVLLLNYTEIPKVFQTPHSIQRYFNVWKKKLTKADDVISGHDNITHAQVIMDNNVIIPPPPCT